MRTETPVLVMAIRMLATEQTDEYARTALREAADRLSELHAEVMLMDALQAKLERMSKNGR